MLRKTVNILLIILLFLPQFGFLTAQETPQNPYVNQPSNAIPQPVIVEETVSFSCRTSSLTDAENQRLLDLRRMLNAFDEINSGTPANTHRQELPNNKALIPDSEGELALQQEFPNQEISPEEVAFMLDTGGKGAFAVGLVLDDTLRLGTCKGDAKKNCPVRDKGLQLKNDGAGIIEAFGNAAEVWKDIIPSMDEKNKPVDQKALDLIAAEAELNNPSPKEGIEVDVKNPETLEDSGITVKTAKRVQGSALPNRVEAQNFEAGIGTTCQNTSCIISSYSMFDKYFNSMFSADLVLSSLAPTLFGKTAYLFNTAKQRGWHYPFKGTFEKWTKKSVDSFITPGKIRNTVEKFDFLERKYGFNPYIKDLYIMGDMTSHGGYANWEAKFWSEYAPKITTYEERRKFVDLAVEVNKYAKLSNATRQFVEAEYKAGRITKAEAGRQIADLLNDWDNGATHFDFSGYFMKEDRSGLRDAYFRSVSSDQIVPVSGKNVAEYVNNDFATAGQFGERFEAVNGALKVYRINPVGSPISANVPMDTLEASVRSGQYANQRIAVQLNNGKYLEPTVDNLDYIRINTPGTVDVFKAGYAPSELITPDNYADRILTYAPTRFGTMEATTGKLVTSLREHQWASRPYFSLLDKAMLEEKELLKSYLGSIKGAAKWTAIPFAYWYVKKGVNLENASVYRLPETWQEISFIPGTESIYNDAFIDFFSNAGSDEGDIFVQMLNKLPWKGLVLNPAVENLLPSYANMFKSFTGEGLRPKVEELAFFLYGPQRKCSSCTSSLKSTSEDNKQFAFAFTTKEPLNSFILENTVSDKAKKQGQTLITYAHHTDLQGKTEDGIKNTISLTDAIADEKTCSDAAKEALGIDLGARGSAAVLGITESLGYAFFGTPGLIGSAIQQLYFAPKFNDCVDTREGYFTHVFSPTETAKKSSNGTAVAGAEKAASLIESGQKAVDNLFTGMTEQTQSKSETEQVQSRGESAEAQGLTREELQQKEGGKGVLSNAADRIKEGTDKLVSKIQEKDIVQANFKTQGQASGQALAKGLFWMWFEGTEWAPTKYKTKGVTNLVDTNTEKTLTSDFEKGQISFDGKVLVNEDGSRPEFQRLEEWNFKIPAKEIPERLTGFRMPGSKTLLFEMSADGIMFLKESQVRACIEQAVLEQTGVPLYSDNLSHTFGFVNFIQTDASRVTPNNDSIIVEGPLRFIAEGASSITQVFGNRDVNVSDALGLTAPAGLLESIQFEHGLMVYNPQTNELIIWLKHHKMAIPTTQDVRGLKANLSSAVNPETGCEEPAIDLSLIANPESGTSAEKVGNFNKGLEKNSPFQIFDTDKATFMFYSGPPPECTPHFRMIDRATGNVYDQAIKLGSLKQTPTGIEFQTMDGKTHTLDFSAPDGKPILTYNGQPQNLLAAQGKNGSFYFDPERGEYYAENGQLIPLNDKFRQGISAEVKPDGTVAGVPGQNIFAPQISSGEEGSGLLNLPSMPQELVLLVIFISAISASIVLVRVRK